jgi:hypothetical protein
MIRSHCSGLSTTFTSTRERRDIAAIALSTRASPGRRDRERVATNIGAPEWPRAMLDTPGPPPAP